jgi:hypothetical protein
MLGRDRRPYPMWLIDGPLRRRCRAGEETSPVVVCESESLVTLSMHYLGSFSLNPEDVRSLGLGETWNFNIKLHGSN